MDAPSRASGSGKRSESETDQLAIVEQLLPQYFVKLSSGTASIGGKVTNFGYQLTNDYESGADALNIRTPLIGIYGGN
jgi:hypothetical protein